ncbi:protein O-mannosyl-transferase TMTC1 isoform X2 [Nilaparvata lugens]|uniref:protein O-mannosyl-transferase TMTC1 isoform X1 n=1 Tax=Nilaparvata lugens TaxID=108931 RepID=UPI00193CF80C|nr:protein O-mannosyl-transferase TMTC1 isoform X1 [Nilaparvata lugens]XP_039295219.1 protein O-mannosyl-transferase TMTC1 isoform X2 [Nilaparvata lugens]
MGRHATYTVVGGLAVALYVNSLRGEFVHDDVPAIVRNNDVTGQTPLHRLLVDDFWGTPMSDPFSHKSYRPLTTLTFRANYWSTGLQPFWFHLCNVLLHAACCMLFTRLALNVAKLQTRFAVAAGLIFAAHPVHTEAVSGVVGRADVLACLIFLMSFLLYHDEEIGKYNVTASCILAGLAMLAKETGLTVLLVNLVYDLYKSWPHVKRILFDGKRSDEAVKFTRRAAKVLVAMSALLIFRLALLQGSLPKFSAQDNPTAFHPCPHVRLMTFCYLAVFNCWLLFCPATLSHDWQMGSIPLVTSLGDYRNVATCIFFGCCLLLAYRCFADFEFHRHSPLVLGCLLLVIPFLPAANLMVTVGFVLAERVLYIPSAGAVLLIVYGAQILNDSGIIKQRKRLKLAFLILLACFSFKTVYRNRDWATRESLIRSGLRALPHNAKMHYNLANYHRDTSRADLAVKHYREALRLWPTYASAHNNLGTLMTRAEDAENHFQSAIQIQPKHVNAHYNLGQVYRKMNRSMQAVEMLERCLRLDASYTPAYLLLAKMQPGPLSGRLLRHVTRLHPENPDILSHYAEWLHENQRTEEAIYFYTRAMVLQSNHKEAFSGWIRCLRSKGRSVYLHHMLMRFRSMTYSKTRTRIVPDEDGERFFKSWDLYKQGQVTSQFNHVSHVICHYNLAQVIEQGFESSNAKNQQEQHTSDISMR